jgi:hypothetical protein
MKKQTEAYIQNQIFIWFHNTYKDYIIHACPNGGKRDTAEAVAMKNTGTVAGISDLIIWLPNQKAIMVEVKDYKGKQSPAQIKIQKKLENIGGVYLLVRSLSEFQQQIKNYL